MDKPTKKETCKNCKDCPNKAKKDVPVKQMGVDHCTDIANHISPLTKVSDR